MNNNLMNRDNNNGNLSNNFTAYGGSSGGNGGDNLFNTVVKDTQPTPPSHGMAIASMVLGIVSLALIVVNIGFLGQIYVPGSLIAGIVGIVLAAVAEKRGNKTSIRKAGLITSIISTALYGAILGAFCSMCGLTSCAFCSLVSGM